MIKSRSTRRNGRRRPFGSGAAVGALGGAIAVVLSGCTSDGLEAPTDGGDPVAYCSLAASIVGQADLNEALTEMVAVAAPTVADATKSAAEGDRGEHARAVEAYVLDECGVVLDLGQ